MLIDRRRVTVTPYITFDSLYKAKYCGKIMINISKIRKLGGVLDLLRLVGSWEHGLGLYPSPPGAHTVQAKMCKSHPLL